MIIFPILLGGIAILFLLNKNDSEVLGKIELEPLAGESSADYTIRYINAVRESVGVPPLEKAILPSGKCIIDQCMDYKRSGIPHRLFGICGEKAQNQCMFASLEHTRIPYCLKTMHAEGPGLDFEKHGHYLNMVNPDYTRVAVMYMATVLTIDFY